MYLSKLIRQLGDIRSSDRSFSYEPYHYLEDMKVSSSACKSFICVLSYHEAPKGGSGSESGTLRRKERSRSKSPFRSFRWKKTAKSPSLDRSGVSDDEHGFSGKRFSSLLFKS